MSCAQSELTSLRQQILRELKRRDLCAARIVSTPSRDESPASLDILLNCHAQRFKQCNELALHVSSLPAVRRVRWGRRAAWPH
ncbi:hypothetical protein CEK28_10755 [Xenophilus sp. AP218F]|nr:hypothetical protein CEK28_10755 [Xenophilus sp. AP218F]